MGATGGVGSYLTQLAARQGATVIAATRAQNAGYARSLGATETIDYTKGDLLDQIQTRYAEGLDAIIDFFSDGPTLTRLSKTVRREGLVVSASGGVDLELLSQRGLQGINVNRASASRLAELTELIDKGELRVAPTRAFALEDASSALAEIQRRHVRGKLVIKPR